MWSVWCIDCPDRGCACRMSAVPYSRFLYWFYIGSHVVCWSMIIKSTQVECFLHWLSWSWTNSELWSHRMCSVPYSTLLYCLFYIGSHVVSWSIIINGIHVECFVHRLSCSWRNSELWSCRIFLVPYSTLLYCLFYIGSHVVSWSVIINTIHVYRVFCA